MLQTAQRFKQMIPVIPNSTLNQKFEVFSDLTPNVGEIPFSQYFAIGINGATVELGTNGLYKTVYREYSPRWCSLLTHIPFILRKIDSDLSPSERINFRMRKILSYNGVQYVGYFLKKFDPELTSPLVMKLASTADAVDSVAWSPQLSDLNPVPFKVNPNEVIFTGDESLAVLKKLEFYLSPTDIKEVLNAVNIIYGDEGYANITEMGLVSGLDRTVNATINGNPTSYTEAIYAQITDFIKTDISCPNSLLGSNTVIYCGTMDPLLIYGN